MDLHTLIGRIVHFVLPDGRHTPAIITEIGETGPATLQVLGVTTPQLVSAEHSLGEEPGTFHTSASNAPAAPPATVTAAEVFEQIDATDSVSATSATSAVSDGPQG